MSVVTDADVVVVGAGQSGAALAALLLRETALPNTRLLLLAPDAPPAQEPPLDAPCELRVVALSPASQEVLRRAGAWERLPPQRLCHYEHMRVWHASLPPDGLGTLHFAAAEVGVPVLGTLAENARVTRACLDSYHAAGGVSVPTAMTDFRIDDSSVHITLADGRVVHSRLLVGADGARSSVRATLGIPLQSHAYEQTAIIANVASERPHRHTAWQRFLPTGPVALLPLFNGQCSIVWSADDALAQELLVLPPAEFARRLEQATDSVLGTFEMRSERAAFPLERATARRLVAPRAALLGDAAHRIHPLAGQGINLGFLDAAALCDAIGHALAEREDPGSVRALRTYEQQRLTDDTLMSVSMSAFNGLFSQAGAAGWVGSRLLGLAGIGAPMRRALARRAMGLSVGPRMTASRRVGVP
jgi:2-octaprenylphenol hydroxylase